MVIILHKWSCFHSIPLHEPTLLDTAVVGEKTVSHDVLVLLISCLKGYRVVGEDAAGMFTDSVKK